MSVPSSSESESYWTEAEMRPTLGRGGAATRTPSVDFDDQANDVVEGCLSSCQSPKPLDEAILILPSEPEYEEDE